MFRPELVLSFVLVFLSGCRACVAQHDPSADWQKFEKESSQANQPESKLTTEGTLPNAGDQVADVDPITKKYNQLCATCHGATGEGNGPAGSALKPPPRNFVTWAGNVTDEHIAKVIREGGPAVGLSASMAPWGSVLSADDISGLVKKIREFRKQ
jgi:mono/diheme cytochrome c family protein